MRVFVGFADINRPSDFSFQVQIEKRRSLTNPFSESEYGYLYRSC
jgi:hypothetical protein